jgi:hypothetical protein
MRGYLSEDQLSVLSAAVGSALISVNYHYWDNGDQRILNWIEFGFANKIILVLTVGSLAEDIDIVQFDKNALEQKLGVRIISTNAYEFDKWRPLFGLKLDKLSITDYKGYCNSSVIFEFMHYKVEVMTANDELLVKINGR